jgi:hypothetical protein
LFLINLYTEALAFLLIDWIRNKNNLDKETFIKYLSVTLIGTIERALKRANDELKN